MVTMQYQAQSDMVELIERLERACIRFVHFSKENELRSRVFSEKMGLESGWNCHISLMAQSQDSKPNSPLSSQSLIRDRPNTATINRPDTGDNLLFSGNMTSSKALSMSAPGAINLEQGTVKFDNEVKKTRHSITTQNTHVERNSMEGRESSRDSVLDAGSESPNDGCRSLSCLTDSTDHSAPLHFDMSNRAKLPRGIENIRPHIEQVDNVPLLVSLFTDCTPSSVRTMIQIMQPLYPVLCQKMPPYRVPQDCIGPIDMARALNSIPCSLSQSSDVPRDGRVYVRVDHHVAAVHRVPLELHSVLDVQCLFYITSAGGAMWSGVVTVPTLGTALAFDLHPHVMHRARTARHPRPLDAQMALFVFWCYACKFLPSIVSILVLYGFTLRSFCEQISESTKATSCWLVYPVNVGNYSQEYDLTLRSFHGWGDVFYDGFYLAQHIILALLLYQYHSYTDTVLYGIRVSGRTGCGLWLLLY
ncbi:unnamed protein product [Leptidea sinapis]|uniref:Uncharacterized protein n=1 Tax=Leptidea sinapis TaxID=189913 RepID=A0A5E4QLU0_9NEOP|nr:unnamed protein product [Leptidea sinapis]